MSSLTVESTIARAALGSVGTDVTEHAAPWTTAIVAVTAAIHAMDDG